MNLKEETYRIKQIMGILTEDRYKGYKRFLKKYVFTNTPDYILNDIFRETGDLGFEDMKGKSKNEIINYFNHGEGKKYVDRWANYNKKPQTITIDWSDLVEPLQNFLKNKMSGKNPNFPHSREKIINFIQNEPNLGKGDNEPIIVKYNSNGKIEEILGGHHRTYAAFELNNFKPITMKAYVNIH
jgi:hypothetical protein